MRAYRIDIDGVTVESSIGNPYALQVRFDFAMNATFSALLHEVEIHNILPRYLSQESNLVGKTIQFWAGMQHGLPLAKPDQYGLIFSGTIQRAIKIIQGSESKMILYVRSTNTGDAGPVFEVKKGQDVVAAIKSAMSQLPNVKTVFDDQLGAFPAESDDKAALTNLSDLAVICDKYDITMYPYAGGIRFIDSTLGDTSVLEKTIDAEDLIGEPVAINTQEINIQVTLRGDIVAFQKVKLPKIRINPITGITEISAISETGVYRVNELRHCGDYRNPSAEAWVTQLIVLRVA